MKNEDIKYALHQRRVWGRKVIHLTQYANY